jgi:hypothetical protein
MVSPQSLPPPYPGITTSSCYRHRGQGPSTATATGTTAVSLGLHIVTWRALVAAPFTAHAARQALCQLCWISSSPSTQYLLGVLHPVQALRGAVMGALGVLGQGPQHATHPCESVQGQRWIWMMRHTCHPHHTCHTPPILEPGMTWLQLHSCFCSTSASSSG